MDKFKEGDLVKLKSGGPTMTVHSYVQYYEVYICKYWGDKEIVSARFKEGMLEMSE